ncbi:MAG: plasmid stabilization protein [Chloroflexi bacterium HGW-Chloroflexi-2]|jgi:HTH-type transcriptional regulator/antitoxin HigA|nr:MAG: plasmid stabilization protein [Chloroflexi bacterium HGW-Chloroflexi-2]
MNIKIIRDEEEYEAALLEVEKLMAASPGTPEADLLEVLSVLIEHYEQENFPVEMPDPIEAIKFRMEQMSLKQKDLVPFIGSASKVSDILNRRRTLSLSMIRELHKGLGIPYSVLIQDSLATFQEQKYRAEDFPFREMVQAEYFSNVSDVRKARLFAEELLSDLFSVFNSRELEFVIYKHGNQQINLNALNAWLARVATIARQNQLCEFHYDKVGLDFFTELLRFSQYQKGVLLVKEHLNRRGIHFVILPTLSGTHIDGASFIGPDNNPVVAMTLRQDRQDNFWFTLFHELGHIFLHLIQGSERVFFDEFDHGAHETTNLLEKQANQFAFDHLVPRHFWEEQCLPKLNDLSKEDIQIFASQLGMSPAILAGQVQQASGNYQKFSDLLGHHQIREQFTEHK